MQYYQLYCTDWQNQLTEHEPTTLQFVQYFDMILASTTNPGNGEMAVKQN